MLPQTMDEHTEPELVCAKFEKKGKIGWIFQGIDQDWLYLKDAETDKNVPASVVSLLREIFLPQGFPHSVHPDYVPYQIWDTVQAFASTILGTLTTHSIMRGVGVGESTATPLAAAISWILKDGTGMIGRILFAWWNGPELDAQCKKWRLFADVLNDLAMGIELTLPYFSRHSTVLLCLSSGMKSLVGVAGGATRASITQHQALKNNLADVSAKDGSQETCVNLIASLVGVFMLSYLDASSYVTFWYVMLVTIHIYANYRAVRSLCFNTLNEDRLAILAKHYLRSSVILNAEETNLRESVSVFHKASRTLCGFDIVIGDSLKKLIESSKLRNGDVRVLLKALTTYQSKSMTVVGSEDSNESSDLILPDVKNRTIYVALRYGVGPNDIVKAYFRAFLQATHMSMLLDLRPDLIQEAQMSRGPLSRLHSMMGSSPHDIVDRWIDEQATTWTRLLDHSEWTRDSHLLSIGPYRSYGDQALSVR